MLQHENYDDIGWWFAEEITRLAKEDYAALGRAVMTFDLPEVQAVRDVVAKGDARNWNSKAMERLVQAWMQSRIDGADQD